MMIKNILCITFLFFLAGCALQEKDPTFVLANAFYEDEVLCITTPGRAEQQKLRGIQIERRGESPVFSHFFSEGDDMSLKPDSCIPTFDYAFQTGGAYLVTLFLTSHKNTPDEYWVSFIVSQDIDKKQRVVALYQ